MKVSHTRKDSDKIENTDIQLYHGDCLEELKGLPENSIDSCVTDPPYHLTSTSGGKSNMEDKVRGNIQAKQFARLGKGFMGKEWDGGDIAFRPDVWREVYRVLKPGAHLLAFGGTRTYHRMVCAIEDAGFEIRDQIQWLYGQGFPKSRNVGNEIDKAAGVERTDVIGAATDEAKQWQGRGTALKPANEPIVLARKPLSEKTVAANVLKWGTGGLNIDACRIPANDKAKFPAGVVSDTENVFNKWGDNPRTDDPMPSGRFPANVIHDGSEEVEEAFTAFGERGNGWSKNYGVEDYQGRQYKGGVFGGGGYIGNTTYCDSGSASRFFMKCSPDQQSGRFPANVIHDGSDEVLALFPDTKSGTYSAPKARRRNNGIGLGNDDERIGSSNAPDNYGDSGSAAQFFYSPKANNKERNESKHPTVKPIALMRYLVKLITPPNGIVLDPFAGSGTTGQAALEEDFQAVLIEKNRNILLILSDASITFQPISKTL